MVALPGASTPRISGGKRLRVADGALDARQCPGPKLQGHERGSRKGRGQLAGQPWRDPEAPLVGGMAQHDQRFEAVPFGVLDRRRGKARSNPAALVAWPHRHRRERGSAYGTTIDLSRQPAERDVADEPVVDFGNKGCNDK